MRINSNRDGNKNYCLSTNKKVVTFLFLTALLMVLTLGCGNSDGNTENTGGTKPTQEGMSEPQPEPAPTEAPTSAPIESQTQTPASIESQTQTPASNEIPTLAPTVNKDPGLNLTASKLVWGGTSTSEVKQIALTFDTGWEYDKTHQLLEVLNQYQVKATFFLRGGWVKDHPDLTQEIISFGHLIGSHSQAHGHMNAMTQDEMTADIIESTNGIKNAIGYAPTMFRPPYGEYNNRLLNVLGEQGYPYTVMWTVDSHDWAETMNGVRVTEQYIIDRVLSKASDNGIVLMHVGGYQTINALPEIITGLRAAGYEVVTLDALF